MSPNTFWGVLSFPSVFNGRIFPFLPSLPPVKTWNAGKALHKSEFVEKPAYVNVSEAVLSIETNFKPKIYRFWYVL